jgi:hypothetical protein
LFSFDWKIPIDRVIQERNDIKGWAIMPGPAYRQALNMPISQWFPIWFNQKLLTDKLLFIGSILSPFIISFLYFFNKGVKIY